MKAKTNTAPAPKPLKAGEWVEFDVHYNHSKTVMRGKILALRGTSADVQLEDGRRCNPFVSNLRRVKK